MSQTFSRTYTIISADLEKPFITNTAIAYIKVKHNKWVVTQPASATITRGQLPVPANSGPINNGLSIPTNGGLF
jgi:hypothetical protein